MNSLDSVIPDQPKVASFLSVLLLLAIIGLLGGLSRSPELATLEDTVAPRIDPVQDPRGHASAAREEQITERFQQAVMMLHAGEYEYAITALHRVIALAPRMPEAYVNMGYALLGLKQYAAARDFFQTAVDLRPYQGNAYWGLAVAAEGMNDLPVALGAMRTYIHLAPSDPASEDYVRRARAALWEWENTLKRGPLPKEEAEWLARRGQEWVDRNSPDADSAESGRRELSVAPAR